MSIFNTVIFDNEIINFARPRKKKLSHPIETSFSEKYSLDKRINEINKLLSRHPNRIPLLVAALDDKQPRIKQEKFLIPGDFTLSQFMFIIKKYIEISSEEAIFLFTKENTIIPSSWEFSQIYDNYKSEDKFLYLFYSIENTFG